MLKQEQQFKRHSNYIMRKKHRHINAHKKTVLPLIFLNSQFQTNYASAQQLARAAHFLSLFYSELELSLTLPQKPSKNLQLSELALPRDNKWHYFIK